MIHPFHFQVPGNNAMGILSWVLCPIPLW